MEIEYSCGFCGAQGSLVVDPATPVRDVKTRIDEAHHSKSEHCPLTYEHLTITQPAGIHGNR